MIDLRSDTLTMPNHDMLETILTAPLGDDGRTNSKGRGEDASINKLEDIAALMVGKEASVLMPSGTMGNSVAMFTHCRRGDHVLIEKTNHAYVSEGFSFSENYGGVFPIFYKLDHQQMPDVNSIDHALNENKANLLWLENTHNFADGAIITPDRMKAIREVADYHGVPIHMDGARIFHSAVAQGVDVKELTKYVDSVMFCLSKGLGAPVGSLLCGSSEFVFKARKVRKIFGGGMRQGGIIAAPALYALQHNVGRLVDDINNAKLIADELNGRVKRIQLTGYPHTNIVIIDTSQAGINAEDLCIRAESKGLLIKPVLNDHLVRLVLYKGISQADALQAAKILVEIDQDLLKEAKHDH